MRRDEIVAALRPESLAVSLFGCDGGNVDADLWVCGIEFGGDHRVLLEWCGPRHYPAYGVEGDPLLIPWRGPADIPAGWRRSGYDRRVARFCLRLLGWHVVAGVWPPTDEGPGDEVDAFLVEHLYDRNSPILKFNLFAYARPNTVRRVGRPRRDAHRLHGTARVPGSVQGAPLPALPTARRGVRARAAQREGRPLHRAQLEPRIL